MLILLAAATADLPAHPTWTMVAENDRGVMAYDPGSVERRGALAKFWTRAATLDDDGMALTMLVQSEIDCAARTFAKRRYVPLDNAGQPMDDEALSEPGAPIAANSVGAALFDRVCP